MARPESVSIGHPRAVVYPDNLAGLGVCRGLGAHGIPVTVLSSDRTAPGQYSRYGRRVACPANPQDAEFVRFLIDVSRRQGPPPVLFLTDDASVMTVNQHRPLLEDWYRFPLAAWAVVKKLLLKDELYRSLEGVVPVPRTRVPASESELSDVAREIGFPAIVKPLLRCLSDAPPRDHKPFEKVFGAKALRVQTSAHLASAYRAARAHGFVVIVQEEVQGPVSSLYSLGLYATRTGQVAATFTSQKLGQVPADFGDGLIVKATRAPELIPLGERVVRHFGYYGLADIEFKWDRRERVYKLLDINPRPWLWINLPTACGVNLPYAAYLDAVGGSLDPSAFVQRDFRTRWISLRGLLVYVIRSLRAARPPRGLVSLLGHARGPRVGPLFSTDDLLFRMFLSPAYWWGSLRGAAGGLRHLRTLRQE